ncbi:hypothetical protein WAI453_004774 [Rhynchosporium graminicola]|uniref:Uncharacterized protein n=1 Tax=Rhynchosporium graminicola TaxID=2792576 RepID=A0A1E1LG80_9HELO|nr:uncharacterized protein RCO7_15026 [Rhynchosporium commune]
MQFSNFSLLVALSFVSSVVFASPIEPRDGISCKIAVATTQSTCMGNVPIDANGLRDEKALAECFKVASAGYNSCPDAEKRGVMTCEAKVVDLQTACIKGIATRLDGTMDSAKIMSCTSASSEGFHSCISAKKRDVFVCADTVTAVQLNCLEAAGTDSKKVSQCSSDAYNGFVRCV